MSDAYIIALISLTFITLAAIRDRVGPLLVISRCLDRIRGDCYCLGLSVKAAFYEWRTMRESCLVRAQRHV